MLIIERLKISNNFSPLEKTIADYLLKQQEKIEKQSAHYIAKQLFTTPSSIVRFCQKIGYQGYNEFKEAYVKEQLYLSQHFDHIDPNRPFNRQDKNMTIANKMGALYHEIIEDVLTLVDHDALQYAINLLKEASSIEVYALGVQLDIAQTFKDKMLKIGKNVITEEKADEMFYRSVFCEEKTVFVFISYSGETETLLRIAEKLKERHIPLIVMTTYGENSLSQYAECVLYVSTREKLINNLGSFSMNLSTLFLLDILYASIFNENYEQNFEKRVNVSKAFEQYRTTHNRLLKDRKE